ncbi:MAG: sugar ABC transporter ATP-binding protein, partial [Longimicrobiales bacterium]
FQGITKRFPGVLALDAVTIEIAGGSCHALCGENGAGKSTLGKVLAGIHVPDSGRILVHGERVHLGSPHDALAAGIGMVHQELAFCDNLSVAENLCLRALPTRRGIVQRAELWRRATAKLAEIGASLDVRRPLGELNLAQQQLVQIAAAVGGGARIIVFDEPTNSLSQVEAERLYDLIGRLQLRGVTCIYVSHRMPEIFRLCDTVTVLRDGRHVGTRPVVELSESELVHMMIGRTLDMRAIHASGEAIRAAIRADGARPARPGGSSASRDRAEPERGAADARDNGSQQLLRVEGLSSAGKFEEVSFSLHAGEVIGLAGLVGAGRSEIAMALFGLDRAVRGSIYLEGRRVRIRSPREAIRLGIGLVPEDRKRQGLVLSETALHNTSLPILRRLSRFSWLRRDDERALVTRYVNLLRVRTASLDALAAGLSGGNQQKLVLAKWLAASSRILMLDEPTRGVDVGAKAEIHELIDQLAAQGHGILLISSELPEILRLCGRILVLRAGRLTGAVAREQATQDGLLRLMAGLAVPAPAEPDGVASAVLDAFIMEGAEHAARTKR